MDSVKLFTAKEVKQLRQPVATPGKGRQGWSKSKIDPAEVLRPFPALRLKKGLVLRAYQFRSGGSGNAVVWAMPEDSPFSSPEHCPASKDAFLEPPRPPLALDDFMEAIEGDGSHWSYLSAHILAREMSEFGSLGHGCDWGTHEIIDKAPYDYFNQFRGESDLIHSNSNVDDWAWLEEAPKEWQPSVCKKEAQAIVTFYSFSGLGVEAIYRHVSTFQTGTYSFKTKEAMIAQGSGGYIF